MNWLEWLYRTLWVEHFDTFIFVQLVLFFLVLTVALRIPKFELAIFLFFSLLAFFILFDLVFATWGCFRFEIPRDSTVFTSDFFFLLIQRVVMPSVFAVLGAGTALLSFDMS